MCGSAARIAYAVPFRFTSSISSRCSRESSRNGPYAPTPAFATTMSMPPNRSAVSAHSAVRASRSRTSHAPATTPGSPRSEPRREASPRFAPRSWSARATAAPIPPLAPVIIAVFPLRVMGRPYSLRPVIEFHLDPRSGVATYLQIVQQVKEALRLGTIEVGDQLPTVREVVADLAINPNTVAKAYRELEREGLVIARQGRGTFISNTLARGTIRHHDALRESLERWLDAAQNAGLDEESIRALISSTLRETLARRVA